MNKEKIDYLLYTYHLHNTINVPSVIDTNKNNDNSWLILTIPRERTEDIKVITLPPKKGDLYCRALGIIDFINYMRKNIEDADFYGDFCFGLHDSYDEDIDGLFVFSKDSNKKGILIPDYYALRDYSGCIYTKAIDKTYENKWDCGLFIGSSTGNRDDSSKNERLNFCNSTFLYDSKCIKGFCSNIVQLDEDDISNAYPHYKKWCIPPAYIEEQLKFKCLISIDGNTSCWDRVPWILNSNSVLIKHKSNNICWYYPLLIKDTHYLEFSMDEQNWIVSLERLIEYTSKNIKFANAIVKEANNFVNQYLTKEAHLYYFKNILKLYSGRTVINKP